jgi:hypothetical protein
VQGGECQLYDVTTTISREILAQSFLPFVVIPRSEIALQIQIVYSTTELLISPIVAEIYRSSSTEPKEPSAVSWISELLTNLLVPARRWVPTDKTGQGLQLIPMHSKAAVEPDECVPAQRLDEVTCACRPTHTASAWIMHRSSRDKAGAWLAGCDATRAHDARYTQT